MYIYRTTRLLYFELELLWEDKISAFSDILNVKVIRGRADFLKSSQLTDNGIYILSSLYRCTQPADTRILVAVSEEEKMVAVSCDCDCEL